MRSSDLVSNYKSYAVILRTCIEVSPHLDEVFSVQVRFRELLLLPEVAMRSGRFAPTLALGLALAALPCLGQEPRKVSSEISVPNVNGIFLDPVPNAAFSAILEITSRQKLPDGSFHDLRTINVVARDSVGRTYQEGRRLVAEQYQGEPPLQSFHIYDPNTELDTRLDPFSFIARQTTKKEAKAAPGLVPVADPASADPPVKSEELGTKTWEGIVVHGIRQSKAGEVVDEYWYSSDLAIYLIRKHTDPKWEQTFMLTKLDRTEPGPARFVVPKEYKIADAATPSQAAPASPTLASPGAYRVGGGVSAPRIVHSENPQYTEQARAAKINGICMLAVVVGTDGMPQDVRIVRKLGYGLDEQAVEAVRKYRFEPAMHDGKPVPVEVNIQVAFKIY